MIEKLQRKFGKYAIKGLMKYVIIVYAAGYIANLINPEFYYTWLMLDIDKVLHGQVWRIVTFLIQPMESNILFMLLMLYVYYSIGTTLEHVWGTFFFNLYYLTGILCNILAVVVIYVYFYFKVGFGISYPIQLSYINLSMLLAFSVTFPETRFYLMFIIPFKAKYLAILYMFILGFNIFQGFSGAFYGVADGKFYIISGFECGICTLITILAALVNFFVYFAMIKRHLSPRNIKRKMEFKRAYRTGAAAGMNYSNDTQGHKVITRHKCAVCGRTELDGENLQFRFCSKCNGNYEYCQDHLFTHTHIE